MTSLNQYQSYFDHKIKEGICLFNGTINNMKTPLEHEEMTKPILSTNSTVTLRENVGDPATITTGGHRNILKISYARNIEICQGFASVIWGDQTFIK